MATETTEAGTITRRQLLLTATAGGAAIIATAWGATQVGSALQTTRTQYEAELKKLRALISLYEQLDKIGLDSLVGAGINVMRTGLEALRAGVRLLRDGITAGETAFRNFQTMLDGLRGAADSVTRVINDLAQKFKTAEGIVIGALGATLPLAESIGNFFNALLQKIPFVGDDIRRALTALVDLIRAIPTTVDAVTNQLIKPLRDLFFPATGDPLVRANLVDPISRNVLEPLKKFLSDVDEFIARWEKDFAKPVQAALDERQAIRKQIVALNRDQANV